MIASLNYGSHVLQFVEGQTWKKKRQAEKDSDEFDENIRATQTLDAIMQSGRKCVTHPIPCTNSGQSCRQRIVWHETLGAVGS